MKRHVLFKYNKYLVIKNYSFESNVKKLNNFNCISFWFEKHGVEIIK